MQRKPARMILGVLFLSLHLISPGISHSRTHSGDTEPPGKEKTPVASRTASTAVGERPGNLPPSPASLPRVLQDDGEKSSLIRAIQNQLRALENPPPAPPVRFGNVVVTRERIRQTLQAFLRLLRQNLEPEEFSRRVRQQFFIYEAGGGPGRSVQFTGYYTPVIQASRFQTRVYKYPLYYMPDNMLKVILVDRKPWRVSRNPVFHSLYKARNFTRGEIDGENALGDRNLEIAWLKDDIERFFLHIQGSGVLMYINGATESVQYIGDNGYPYRGIGKLMLRDGVLGSGDATMQGIKRFLMKYPQAKPKYFFQNKRYIFFKLTDDMPRGSSGAEVVAHRSIATDKTWYPSGGLAFITAHKPILDGHDKLIRWEPFSRFVMDQDSGNAIKGPARADLYFGIGPRAGAAAGLYKMKGKLYYLLKK